MIRTHIFLFCRGKTAVSSERSIPLSWFCQSFSTEIADWIKRFFLENLLLSEDTGMLAQELKKSAS